MRTGLNRRGQTWASDLMLAIAIFLVAFIIFFYVLNASRDATDIESLKKEGQTLHLRFVRGISDSNISFIIDNTVDTTTLAGVSTMDYQELKNILGVQHDFCVYFEDHQGYLINISAFTGEKPIGIGSSDMLIAGEHCG
ncbi:MAG: hypothetical protein ABIC95_05330 [archaeon]